ncbi:MAG: DUF1573 domain-containing protein [Desulfobacterales bacterium]|jgi:hypothetical protein|nr:DUF1573 domain-containing protein [Desulfobacterales bacterium]
MKRLLAFVSGSFVLLSAAVGFSSQPQAPAPAAFFPQINFQFENALEGQAVEHDFLVQNKGSADLQIEKIKTG